MAAPILATDLPAPVMTRAALEQPTGEDAADLAELRYVDDTGPGITRVLSRTRATYRSPEGRVVRDAATLARIRSLAIPPAWTRVWICPRADGHIQATGRDARGRKQYRYHPRWQQVRDAAKYGRLLAFGRALPLLRARVMRDLQAPPLSHTRVLATVVRLLETTLIRVGNEEYARTNQSFGLTTLRDRHATVTNDRLRFRFRAKSGVWQEVELRDARLARTVKRCQDLPGQVLFQYVDADGTRQRVTSEDVNAYLGEVTGQPFTARTSARGPAPSWPPLPCRNSSTSTPRPVASAMSRGPSSASPGNWATRRPCAVAVTCIRPSSTTTSTGRRWRCCGRRPPT
ncbi:hypothetical protein TBR22_A11830 [Luteitalea sp. TBR-22]|nr:hypothetical protein [Luteitalea sp. TBR-22]BCS31979.1 hypothetical protein TBR22_A11830 [Luteitalea sp. TBR-22]